MEYRLQTLSQLKALVQGFRKKAGLTQFAMAEKLGISQQAYAQIESNLSSTSIERIYTILRLLNVDINLVMTLESNKLTELTQVKNKTRQATEKSLISPKKINKNNDTTEW